MQAMQRRQLLSRGRVGGAAVPGRLILECGESDECDRVYCVSARSKLRDGVDGSRAVRARHVRSEHAPSRVRNVPCRRVSERSRLDSLQDVRRGQLLPAGRICTAAVRRGHLFQQPRSWQRVCMHHLPCRKLLLDGVDSADAVRTGHSQRIQWVAYLHELPVGHVPRQYRLDGVQVLHGRPLLPWWVVCAAPVPCWDLFEYIGAV